MTFERFTDKARRVIVMAQDEARDLNHNYIGTEHLLLGLIESDGIAETVLTEVFSLELEVLRDKIVAIIGEGQQAPSGHIPMTPRAKKVLELSLREALQLGHNYIGTEHLLLALIREGEGVAAQVLVGSGLDLNRVRQAVLKQIGDYKAATTKPENSAQEVDDDAALKSYIRTLIREEVRSYFRDIANSV